VDHRRSSPLLSSLFAQGEFATALRERIEQARDLLDNELAEVVDEIGVRAAHSRLAYLLAVAADHGVDVTVPATPASMPVSVRVSVDEMAR
jgi:hypothetical protein